jgi:hypothetical protein
MSVFASYPNPFIASQLPLPVAHISRIFSPTHSLFSAISSQFTSLCSLISNTSSLIVIDCSGIGRGGVRPPSATPAHGAPVLRPRRKGRNCINCSGSTFHVKTLINDPILSKTIKQLSRWLVRITLAQMIYLPESGLFLFVLPLRCRFVFRNP